jgi:hypothetical protein
MLFCRRTIPLVSCLEFNLVGAHLHRKRREKSDLQRSTLMIVGNLRQGRDLRLDLSVESSVHERTHHPFDESLFLVKSLEPFEALSQIDRRSA